MTVWANVLSYEIALFAQDSNGRSAGAVHIPELSDELRALRDEMYEPERGTWLSALFVLNRGSEPEVSFNYDDDPQWSPALHPMMFVCDLEAYPRADEHIPQWLRAVLNHGLELQREHEAGLSGQ